MNWKYIIIVVILAVIVGGGILAYQYWWLPNAEVKPLVKEFQYKCSSDADCDEGYKCFIEIEGVSWNRNKCIIIRPETQEECDSKDGWWRTAGESLESFCDLPDLEAGKECTNALECMHECLVEPHTASKGHCTKYTTYGCITIFDSGGEKIRFCID